MERIGLSSGGSKVKDSWENENYIKYDKDYPYGYPWPPKYYTCNFCQREFKSAQALGGHMNIHRKDRARLNNNIINNNNNNNNNNNFNNNPFCPNNNNNNENDNDPFCPNNNIHQNPNLNSNPSNPNPNPTSNPSNPNPNPNISTTRSLRFSNPSSITNGNIYAHQYSLVSLSLSTIPPPIKVEKADPTTIGSRDGFGGDCEQRFEKWRYMSSPFEHYNDDKKEVSRVFNNYNIGSSTNNNNKEIVRLDLELCLGEAKEDLDLELRLGI